MLRDDELPLLKQCARCGSEKPVTNFNKQRGAKDGLQSECKQCQSNRYFGDLITRLRTMSATGWHPIGNEAADEIDRLTRERDEARAERDAMAKDTWRLDWLDAQWRDPIHLEVSARSVKGDSYVRECVLFMPKGEVRAADVRSTIDAALAQIEQERSK